MSLQVRVLRRAKLDIRHIASWIRARSRSGADSWLGALNDVLQSIADQPESFGIAPEDDFCEPTIRQALFRTRRGRTYRVLFTIIGMQARVLRVRGPGQSPLEADELG